MRNLKKWVLVPAVVTLVAACGRGESAKVDEGLKNDLALASQMQPYQPQQYMSPAEMGYQNGYAPYGQQYPGMAPQGYVGQPVYQPAPQPVTQRATVRRTSSSGARRSSGSSQVVYREPRVIRNTKRDAIIGAVAGGALGAVTSRDKVKGAIIGAAAGGVLGGIIGHTIDVKRVP